MILFIIINSTIDHPVSWWWMLLAWYFEVRLSDKLDKNKT